MSCLSLLLATSIHVGLASDYNSVHPHIRCEVEHSMFVSTIVGAYQNSESNTSYYYGKKMGIVELGLVSGYSRHKVLPLIRLIQNGWFISPSYEIDNWGATIGYEVKLF
jgi:hypothetical protein